MIGYSAETPDLSSVTPSLSNVSSEATSFSPHEPHAKRQEVKPLWIDRSQCSQRESPKTAPQEGHIERSISRPASTKGPPPECFPTNRGCTARRDSERVGPRCSPDNPRRCGER